jgi:hypothetical protein
VDFILHNLIVSGFRRSLDATRSGTIVLVARTSFILLIMAFQLLDFVAQQQNRTTLSQLLSGLRYTKLPQLALLRNNRQPFQYPNTCNWFCCSFSSI